MAQTSNRLDHNWVPRLRCACCNKPVDKVAVEVELYLDVLRVRAFCHGEMDEMILTMREMHDMTQAEIGQIRTQVGVAFASQAQLTVA